MISTLVFSMEPLREKNVTLVKKACPPGHRVFSLFVCFELSSRPGTLTEITKRSNID